MIFVFATPGFAQGAPRPSQITGYASKIHCLSPGAPGQERIGSSPWKSPIAGTTTSVNTINPTVSGPGSVLGRRTQHGEAAVFQGKTPLSAKAIERGARLQSWRPGAQLCRASGARAKSGLHGKRLAPPILSGKSNGDRATDKSPGLQEYASIRQSQALNFPSIVGPFNYIDLRASLTQSILDLTARNNYRSANEVHRANQFLRARCARSGRPSRWAGRISRSLPRRKRVKSARAQFETAKRPLSAECAKKRSVGFGGLRFDVDRSESRKRLLSNNGSLHSRTILAKQKNQFGSNDRIAPKRRI